MLRPYQIGCLLLTIPLVCARANEPPPATPQPDVSQRIQSLLSETESLLGRPPDEKLALLAIALRDRGFDQAARQVGSAIQPLPVQTLTQNLLEFGQPDAAMAVIESWKRDEPDNANPLLMETLAAIAQGSPEIAVRSLARYLSLRPPEDKSFAQTLQSVVEYLARTGTLPGIEGNPWNVQFLDETGQFTPGQVDPAELAKVPPGSLEGLVRIVRYLPRSGPLWALLGEFANAQGNVDLAVQCYDRAATVLLYSPRPLLEKLRAAQTFRRLQQDRINESFSPTPTKTGTKPQPDGWSTLWDRPKALVIVLVGGILMCALLALQIRVWWTRPRGKDR